MRLGWEYSRPTIMCYSSFQATVYIPYDVESILTQCTIDVVYILQSLDGGNSCHGVCAIGPNNPYLSLNPEKTLRWLAGSPPTYMQQSSLRLLYSYIAAHTYIHTHTAQI